MDVKTSIWALKETLIAVMYERQ